MISRLGMYDLARQIHQSQRVPDSRDYAQVNSSRETASYREELGMFLRLGAVIFSAMAVGVLIMWARH